MDRVRGHRPRHGVAELRGALTAVACGLVLLAVSAFVDRTFPPLDAFRTLWPQLSAAMIVCGVVLLALRARRRGALTLFAAIIFGLLVVRAAYWTALPIVAAPANAQTLRVLTLNALVNNSRPDAMARAIRSGGYDVVAIQEGAALEAHYAKMAAELPYQTGCAADQPCDLVVLSRYPLDDVRWTPFETRASWSTTATVTVDDRTVGLLAIHLTKPHHDGNQRFEVYRTIRVQEALPEDAFVLGDFNAAPWSGLLGWFRGATGFAHPAGYRPTAPARVGALGVAIDQVMTRGRIGVSEIGVLPNALGSNHFGVEATLFLSSSAPDP